MQATAGDVIRLRGNARGQRDRVGCVIDARGAAGGPPYLVRFTDGRVSLVYEAPGGLAERPASRVSTAVARASSVRPRPRPPAYLPIQGLLVALAVPAFVAFFVVRGVNGNVPGAESLLVTLAAVALAVPAVMLSRRASPRWRAPVRLLLVGSVLAAQTLAMLWLGSVYNDHQRCIDPRTMTVIPGAACPGPAGTPGPASPRWYTGGTGLRPGDSVEGGSLAPPASDENDGGGVSGEVGGDDGDVGGDTGGDSGEG